MNKRLIKIMGVTVAAVCAMTTALVAGCGYKGKPLAGDTSGEVKSNGGFVVEKGNYVYFINGAENNDVDNTFGRPEKGAIYRISKSDFAAHNYSSAECVVPLVAYSQDYESGLYIYDDTIYYATPSTDRTQDTNVLSDKLDMKSSKIDGSVTMSSSYVQFPTLAYNYRYVKAADGDVYLMYIATEEKAFEEETAVTNLHSLNTKTGEDTILAYNVDTVMFDAEDKTNPRVYYTMNVKNYVAGSNYDTYNQIYTVTADEKTPNEYDTSDLLGWNEDEDKGEISRYINCGDLVYDGIGKIDERTPFNFAYEGEIGRSSYKYSLTTYRGGSLFYTRTTNNNPNTYMFSYKDGTEVANPIINQPVVEGDVDESITLLSDSAAAANYKYIFNDDGSLKCVIIAESAGVTVNYTVDGKLQRAEDLDDMNVASKYFHIVKDGTATLLFVDGDYLYYSIGDGTGYTVNRIDYTGNALDYRRHPGFDTDEGVNGYTAVKVLDIESKKDWYKPELVDNQLVFASATENMSAYSYIMVCDLRAYNAEAGTYGDMMTNKQIDEYNKLYEGIVTLRDSYGSEDSVLYANLPNALKYAFFTGKDRAFMDERAAACNADVEEGEDLIYTTAALDKYSEYLAPTADNDWKDYTATRKVNGETLYANRLGYYYSVLGKMTEKDATAYENSLDTSLLQQPVEDTSTWWERINTAAKVGFIIGMCACGIVVLGGITVGVLMIVRYNKNKKLPDYSKKKIKVDTTDDKNIDVYSDEN